MSEAPASRFVIVQRRPRTRVLVVAFVLLWLLSLWAVWALTLRFSAPDLDQLNADLASLRAHSAELEGRVERLRQKNITVGRSDEVSRNANHDLQETLAARDKELADLRNDVAFYERLVGGSAQRQGLTVHSLALRPGDDGSWRYTLTLTQNLKKATVSKGEVTLRVEGVQDGKLSSLAWDDLMQAPQAKPQGFSFKYFQQLEGSLMLPDGFTPHRVRVSLRSDSGQTERVFPWQDTQTEGVS
jgi:hypothetical protein